MHCYETIFILHPDLSDEDVDAAKTRVADIITATGGRIYRRENWGKKRLAYTVLKQQRGIYQLMQYIGTGQTIADLERMFRLDEAFIKFLTVRLKQDPATVPAQMVETGGRAEERPSRDDRGPRDDRGSRDDRGGRDDRPRGRRGADLDDDDVESVAAMGD
jgi:small subunit ribosomal protein S6